MKTMQKITAISGLALMVGCFAAGCINTQSGKGVNNLYRDEKIESRYPPVLVMGSKFNYQDTNLSAGKAHKVTLVMEVKEEKEFEKRPAYWVRVSREGENYFDIYDMNLNWIGSFAKGKELEFAEPCIRVFTWPLRVGQKWSSQYTLRDYSNGFHVTPSKVAVEVQTWEEITVPAGTFKAVRIQAGGESLWYAPSIGWIVKEQVGSYGKDGWLLELVKYSIPHRITTLCLPS